jgi:hypothetical protein
MRIISPGPVGLSRASRSPQTRQKASGSVPPHKRSGGRMPRRLLSGGLTLAGLMAALGGIAPKAFAQTFPGSTPLPPPKSAAPFGLQGSPKPIGVVNPPLPVLMPGQDPTLGSPVPPPSVVPLFDANKFPVSTNCGVNFLDLKDGATPNSFIGQFPLLHTTSLSPVPGFKALCEAAAKGLLAELGGKLPAKDRGLVQGYVFEQRYDPTTQQTNPTSTSFPLVWPR